ncbi:MAG: box helicase [Pedosphaera sp.]|nr:box helicase [Pedosphaera sp.]
MVQEIAPVAGRALVYCKAGRKDRLMTTKLFSELGLSAELLKAIDKLGFEQASPIQAEAIPVLMQGRDVVGQSQTGSGKTAAFAVPAIEKVDPQLRAVQVLILSPTRELAVQISEEVHKLALFKRGIHALPIYGGQSYERQFLGLKQGAQIVIGTPGRVMDHMRRGTLRLDKVKMVILDEADVMLDMGFRDDIEVILQAVPKERQTVFFSATMPKAIRDLIQKYSRDPQTVRIEQKEMTVPTVEQVYYEVDRRYKIDLLTRLIDIHDLKLGIIFCNTKRMVDDLVDHLNAQGYSADRLHGDMSQGMRDRVMQKFRKSGLEFLVATDIAARGIDVDDVQVVFNYDLPYDAEDYLHRIGRTGRAGRNGRAISFVAGRELFQIYNIERFTKVKMHHGRPPTQAEVDEARANVFVDKLRTTLQSGNFKRQDHLVERLLEEGFTSTDIASALLHQLQGGEAVSAAKVTREAMPAERAPMRPPRREREERAPQRSFAEESAASRKPWRAAEREVPPQRPVPVARPVPAARAEKPAAPVVRPAAVPVAATAAPVKPAPSAATQPPPAVAARATTPHVRPAPKTESPRFQRPAAPAAKASRRTPEEQTRLYINVGEEMSVLPGDVVGAILGETGLPANVVGTVDIRERHLFVDVASEHANAIISKLNRTRIKNQKVKVKIA